MITVHAFSLSMYVSQYDLSHKLNLSIFLDLKFDMNHSLKDPCLLVQFILFVNILVCLLRSIRIQSVDQPGNGILGCLLQRPCGLILPSAVL